MAETRGITAEKSLLLTDSTLDNMEIIGSKNLPAVKLLGNTPIHVVSKQIFDAELVLDKPVVILYLGSFEIQTLDRDQAIFKLRGLLNAIRAHAPTSIVYLSCLLPRMVAFPMMETHLQRFNSAVKRAVIKTRNLWGNVRFMDPYGEFLEQGKPQEPFFFIIPRIQMCPGKGYQGAQIHWELGLVSLVVHDFGVLCWITCTCLVDWFLAQSNRLVLGTRKKTHKSSGSVVVKFMFAKFRNKHVRNLCQKEKDVVS